jgi:hypothetical protein
MLVVKDGGVVKDGSVIIWACGVKSPVPVWNTALPTAFLELLLVGVHQKAMVRVEDALFTLGMKQEKDEWTYYEVHMISADDMCSQKVIPAISGTGDVRG